MPDPHVFQSQGSSGSVETLGDDPMRGGLLTDSNGRAFRGAEVDDGRPHMEGTAPNSGSSESGSAGPARGIGGTHLAPALTPEQMMAMANEMEQNQLEDAVRQKASAQMGQSAVQGSLDHTGAQTAGQSPSWLNDYMQHQPFTDPYHQVPMSGLDAIKANKYLTERERLKYTKSLRK